MSQPELREQHKRRTVEAALGLFIEKGVEQTTIRDVARAAELTERSVYRYFETRAELILATTFLFWERVAARVEGLVGEKSYQGMTGVEQVRIMLHFYSTLYLERPEYVRYILNAETALYNAGLTVDVQARPPGRFETSESPMVRAIRAGLEDGSISAEADVEEIYYNAYDAILGTMQRQVLGSTDCALDNGRRMEHLCELFIRALQGR